MVNSRSDTMQPIYHQCSFKIEARKQNVAIYREITGNRLIPDGREYWTLCHYQPQDSGAEIVQMQEMGLLKKGQFRGVDRDRKIITQNKIWHPEIDGLKWYNGEWTKVVEREASRGRFNPSMVYLDMTAFADYWIATDLVVRTIMVCPEKTVLLANVMLNDPRSSRQFDPEKLVKNIFREIPPFELEKWDSKVQNYVYSATGKTILQTYVFHKR